MDDSWFDEASEEPSAKAVDRTLCSIQGKFAK